MGLEVGRLWEQSFLNGSPWFKSIYIPNALVLDTFSSRILGHINLVLNHASKTKGTRSQTNSCPARMMEERSASKVLRLADILFFSLNSRFTKKYKKGITLSGGFPSSECDGFLGKPITISSILGRPIKVQTWTSCWKDDCPSGYPGICDGFLGEPITILLGKSLWKLDSFLGLHLFRRFFRGKNGINKCDGFLGEPLKL